MRGASQRVTVGAVGGTRLSRSWPVVLPRSDELDQALGGLAETLFRWALLLTLAAAEIHRDDELDWGSDDEYSPQPAGGGAEVLIARAETLQERVSRRPDHARRPGTHP